MEEEKRNPHRQENAASHDRTNTKDAGVENSGKSKSRDRKRFLFQAVHDPQAIMSMESYPRSEVVEHIHCQKDIQDGNDTDSEASDPEERLDDKDRFKRRSNKTTL